MSGIHYFLYIAVSLLLSVYLILKSETNHRFITFIIIYWLFVGSILSSEHFVVDIKSWYFNIQPARLILIIFSVYLIVLWGMHGNKKNVNIRNSNKKNTFVDNPVFEKFLYVFLVVYLVVNLAHLGSSLTPRELIASYTSFLVFPVIYLVLKRTADSGMIKTFIEALLIVCVISSIIGIYQFLIDPSFFRYGTESGAYREFLRSNGIFRAEYFQGYFLTSGIIVALFTIHSRILKFFIVALFLLGVICTFHRGAWIITLLLLTIYLIKIKRLKVWQLATISIFLIGFVYVFLDVYPSILNRFENNPFINERLLFDSITSRFVLYNMALHKIPQYFLLGVGSPRSDIYFHGVLEAGGSLEVASGESGGIHNLYLLTAFFYGVPAAIFFCIFLCSVFIYFWKKITRKREYYFIPTSIIFLYIISNMTNMFPLNCDLGLLLAIFLSVFVAIHQKNIKIDPLTVNERDYK